MKSRINKFIQDNLHGFARISTYVFIGAFIQLSTIKAQNCSVCDSPYMTCGQLIRNNSFESQFLPGGLSYCDGNIENACCWFKLPVHKGTPDVLDINYPNDFCGGVVLQDYSPPLATNMNEPPSFSIPFGLPQKAYAGFYTYLDANFLVFDEYRDYFIQYLNTPIAVGETVNISFQVSLGDRSDMATSFEVSFFDTVPSPIYPNDFGPLGTINPANYVTVSPQSQPPPYTVSNIGWVPVTTTWTNLTSGPVDVIMIGNLQTDNSTSFITAIPTNPHLPSDGVADECYYGIDDISIERGQQCCDVDVSYIDDQIYMSAIYSNISSPGVHDIFIQGELIIDGDYEINSKNITFGYDSKVVVQAGNTLTITGTISQPSHLHGCDRMWQGIFADQPGATVNVYRSIIEDARVGVYVKNTGTNSTAYYSKFYNNYVGIQFDNYSSSVPNLIRGTIFQSKFFNSRAANGLSSIGYLLPGYNITATIPMEGKRGEAGILMNYSNLILTPNGITGINRFNYSANGIVAYNSQLIVSNANFYQIKNHDNIGPILSKGRAIHVLNTDAGTNYKLTVYNSTGLVITNQCNNGVWVDGNHTTNINNSRFNNTVYRAICHHSVQPVITGTQINVYDNTITNAYEGIFYQYCGITKSYTADNLIANLSQILGSRGIIIEERSIGVSQICNPLPIEVFRNHVQRFGIGIHTSNASCMNIDHNTIDLFAANNQHHGIWLAKSPHNVVTCNTVLGNFQDWRCIGIRIYNSNDVHVGCNIIDKTEIAFFLDNDCRSSRFANNTMTYYNKGFLLVGGAILSPQATVGLNNYALQNIFDKSPNSLFEFAADQSVLGTNSKFYFENGSASDVSITNIDGAVVDIMLNVLITDATNPLNSYSGFSALINTHLDLRDGATLTAGIGYNDCGSAPGIINNPFCNIHAGAAPPENPIVSTFTSGYIADVEFTPIYQPEHTWMFKHNALRNYKVIKDSINPSTLPLAVIEFIDSLYNSNVAELDSVETLIGLGNYGNALAYNSVSNAGCNYSGKLKETNHILIPLWDSLANNYEYYLADTAIIQSIIDIANLCINEYGDAVLKARIFARNHIDPMLEFYNACEDLSGLQGRSQTMTNTLWNPPDYGLYPNPASDEIKVYTNHKSAVNYMITDIQGRKITEGVFQDHISININQWQNGIYFINMYDIEGSKTLRFIISH